MDSSNLTKLSDEDLVHLIRTPKTPPDRQNAALHALEERYKRMLGGRMVKGIRNPAQFLAAVGRASIEDFCADVLAHVILKYEPGRNAKFSTFLFTVFQNEMSSGFRTPKRVLSSLDRDGNDALEAREDERAGPGPLEKLALAEALELARSCVRDLNERMQKIFLWSVVAGFENDEIHEIWPHESIDNIKQLKHRAVARFLVEWEKRDGTRVESFLEAVAGTMAERIDIDRIRDRRAREAYRLWVKKGDLVSTARELRMKQEELRTLLLKAMHDIFDQAMFRGERADWKALRDRETEISRYLDLAEGARPVEPLLDQIGHTLEIVRAAFGFARPENAVQTLGSFVQRRLAKEEDYETACRDLGLRPAALRRLLADQYEPEKEFYGRLSGFLGVPEERLRTLPRKPMEETRRTLRSSARFDDQRFHARVLAWFRK